jgi:hypothetical protein
MKKRAALFTILLLVFSIWSISIIFAAENTTEEAQGFEAGYQCLENLVTERGYGDLILEETTFGILALGYNSGMQGNLRSQLSDMSLENRCWPSDDCSVKETSLALIALEHIGQSTNLLENWIIEETTEPNDLVWYLQIDTNEEADCTISYEGGSRDVVVKEDKRITGAGGTCFRSAFNGYWLQIDEDCYDEEFEITCESDFITTLTYKRKTASGLDAPYYISALTNQQPADGKTTEKVNSLCFQKDEDSSSCDYESTLWATLALKKLGKDTSPYIPYLIALSSNYDQYFPSSFLYMLTGDEEYFSEIINNQKSEGYWQESNDQTKRYYDTALALLSLKGTSTEQSTRATEWLLEEQQTSGCWRNARDTSFILYSASPKSPSISSTRTMCADSGFYCTTTEQDCEDALGAIKSNYYCASLSKSVCCSVQVTQNLTVIPTGGDDDDTNPCEERGNTCKSFCSDSFEEEVPYSCSGIQACCAPKTTTQEETNYWWVWLLVILVILLILAIIFRNQLKIWFFKIKSKFSKSPVSQQRPNNRPGPRPGQPGQHIQMPGAARPRPGLLPPRGPNPMMQRRPMPRQPRQPRRNAKSFPRERELQDTLKKLKDMGK